MATNYVTVQQRQPLRVPQSFDEHGKQLVVRLDEIFDDIYRRFGRLRIEDMGQKFRMRLEGDEGNITELITDVNGLTTRVSNAEGSITQLNIDVGGLTTRVSNAEGSITQLNVDVGGLTTRVSNAEGSITQLNVDVGGLTTRVSNAEGSITTLNVDVGGLTTRVTNAEGSITTMGATVDGLVLSVANKYDIVSGIAINSSGIDITGNKYVKIRSGGTFDVDTTNFKISSSDYKIVAGSWTFDDKGLKFDGTSGVFEFGQKRTTTADQVIYGYKSSNNSEIRFITKSNGGQKEYRLGGYDEAFYPYNAAGSSLGLSDYHWFEAYIDTVNATTFKGNLAWSYITGKPFSGVEFHSGNKDNEEHNANNAIKNGVYYYGSNGPATSVGASTNDGALFVQSYNDSWVGQIAQDYRNGRLFVRGKNNGTWQSWKALPLADGTGASGTWGISINGAAAKLGTATLGSASQGIYLNAGTPTAVSYYPVACTISGGNTANYPWHRIAYISTGTGAFTDLNAMIFINQRIADGRYGLIQVAVRTNSAGTAKQTSARWIFRKGFAVGDVVITTPTKTTGTDEVISVYVKCTAWPRMIAYFARGIVQGSWNLCSSNEPNDTTPTDKKGGTEIYASVSGCASAGDGGTVAIANSVPWTGVTDKPTYFTSNTTNTSNKTGTKLYLAGATAQGNAQETFSNSNVFITTDNRLSAGNGYLIGGSGAIAQISPDGNIPTVISSCPRMGNALGTTPTNWYAIPIAMMITSGSTTRRYVVYLPCQSIA